MRCFRYISAALRAGIRPAIIALSSILSTASARVSAFASIHTNELVTTAQARAVQPTMSTTELNTTLTQLQSTPPPSPQKIASLLSTAKRQLLKLGALLPTPNTSPTSSASPARPSKPAPCSPSACRTRTPSRATSSNCSPFTNSRRPASSPRATASGAK